ETAGGGNKAIGIEKVMTWLAIIGTVMLLITFLTTKERIVPKPEQKSSVKEDLGDLFKNKPWVIMLLLTTLVFITLAMKGGSYVYYFKNYVDKERLTSFVTPITHALSGAGMNFFGEDPVSAGFGLFISTLFILAFYFFPPQSVPLMFASQILHGFFYGITIPLLWAMIADVA